MSELKDKPTLLIRGNMPKIGIEDLTILLEADIRSALGKHPTDKSVEVVVTWDIIQKPLDSRLSYEITFSTNGYRLPDGWEMKKSFFERGVKDRLLGGHASTFIFSTN